MKKIVVFITVLMMFFTLIACSTTRNHNDSKKQTANAVKSNEIPEQNIKEADSDEQKIEKIVYSFAEKFFEMELDAMLPMVKVDSELYVMINNKAQHAQAGKITENFVEEYEKSGGNPADIDKSMARAKNIVIEIKGNVAKVDAEYLCFSVGTTAQPQSAETDFLRTETNACKDDDGSIRISEKHYYSSDDGEHVGKSRESMISYENVSLTLENVDGEWYITTMDADY